MQSLLPQAGQRPVLQDRARPCASHPVAHVSSSARLNTTQVQACTAPCLKQVRPRRAVPCCCTPRSPVAVSCSSMNNQQGGEDASGQQQPGEEKAQEHAVINTYHLVDVPEPQAVVEEHRAFMLANKLDIRGRIYISSQGINAQFGGTTEHALQYVEWLRGQVLWKDLRHSVWPAEGQMFPKLRLKYKPNLISLAGGLADLPITSPEARATPVPPQKWREMAAEAQAKKYVMLDVRNDYEWDAGHFQGAARPAEEEFNDTPVGDGDEGLPAPLRNADPETHVMMMCTGGIRCDIYSTLLKARGFNNLYTLEGGIQNYFREVGSEHWDGSLFVFDGRMALSPDEAKNGTINNGPRPAAVPCQVCGGPEAELPHVNCANIDCNELFIGCPKCKQELNGCCCRSCMNAPRLLRPAKVAGGNYGTWNTYSEGSHSGSFLSEKAREGRLARRMRRREAIKQRHQKQLEEKAARKTMMREAMAKLMDAQELPSNQQQGAHQQSNDDRSSSSSKESAFSM